MRTLPLRLAPIAGESLTGYITRYAHTFAFAPGDVARALGLDDGSDNPNAEHYGVSLTAEQLQRASTASAIATETLQDMLLDRYRGRAFTSRQASSRDALSGEGYAREVLIRRSRYCPHCLAENRAWLLRWQLSWCIACTRHDGLLVHRCESCETVPWILIRESWPRDELGELRDPTCCATRRSGVLCRASFTDPTGQRPADEGVVTAQRHIDALLDGKIQPTLAGEALEPRAYLRDLRALVILLHRRHDSRPRAARQLLDSPLALAMLLPDAVTLTGLPDRLTLADALRERGDGTYHATGVKLPVPNQVKGISAPLREALLRARSQSVWARPSRRIGIDPYVHQRHRDLHPKMQPRHVPELFWAADYHRELAELFKSNGPSELTGRRFCSAVLARMLTPLNWQKAATYLGHPDDVLHRDYFAVFTDLRRDGNLEELARRIRKIANEHATNGLIDYEQRRTTTTGHGSDQVSQAQLASPQRHMD